MRVHTRLHAVIAAAAVALLTGGCGGSATTAATTSPANPSQSGLVAYSRCMRSHGVPTFPDPTSSDGIPKDEIPIGNPRLPSASNACQHLAPGGLGPPSTAPHTLTRVAAGTAFARCMRNHGFSAFPDPTTGGQITHRMLARAGVNLHQPAALQAADACVSVTHGLLTQASVARFIAGQ